MAQDLKLAASQDSLHQVSVKRQRSPSIEELAVNAQVSEPPRPKKKRRRQKHKTPSHNSALQPDGLAPTAFLKKEDPKEDEVNAEVCVEMGLLQDEEPHTSERSCWIN